MLDVRVEHEAKILAIGRSVRNTSHLEPFRYSDYSPTRKKKALHASLVFIFATFGSIVAADSGITVFFNDPTLLTKPLQAFVPVLLRAIVLAIGPTIVAYCLRRLGQDK